MKPIQIPKNYLNCMPEEFPVHNFLNKKDIMFLVPKFDRIKNGRKMFQCV